MIDLFFSLLLIFAPAPVPRLPKPVLPSELVGTWVLQNGNATWNMELTSDGRYQAVNANSVYVGTYTYKDGIVDITERLLDWDGNSPSGFISIEVRRQGKAITGKGAVYIIHRPLLNHKSKNLPAQQK